MQIGKRLSFVTGTLDKLNHTKSKDLFSFSKFNMLSIQCLRHIKIAHKYCIQLDEFGVNYAYMRPSPPVCHNPVTSISPPLPSSLLALLSCGQ